jgi:ubiquinone/menaquinone biosynthesis C-methylase UbiE
MDNIFDAGSTAEFYRQYLQPVIFTPWSVRLLELVGLRPGDSVLDVAAGTGIVSRAAATVVGPTGRVVASDISPRMLKHVASGADPSGAAIETLESSATDIRLPDASMDVVLCQQGFPFMPDRAAVAREMHRVLRPGGRVGIAVWSAGKRLDPFDTYAEAVSEAGLTTAFGNMASNRKMSMSEDDVSTALSAGGFRDVEVTTERVEVRFATIEDEVTGILGTPLGIVVAGFERDRREEFLDGLRGRLVGADGGTVGHPQFAVIGRGTA